MDIKNRDKDKIKQIIFHLETDELKYKNFSQALDFVLQCGLNSYEWQAFSSVAHNNIMFLKKYRELLELFLSPEKRREAQKQSYKEWMKCHFDSTTT